MLTPANAQKRAQELLTGFPPDITAAYLGYAESGDLARLDLVVMGVLNFYLAKKPAEPLAALAGSTRLVEDLGCDSLTMMDTVFMVETLFEIKLDDTELAKITTLDELRAHLRATVRRPGAAVD